MLWLVALPHVLDEGLLAYMACHSRQQAGMMGT